VGNSLGTLNLGAILDYFLGGRFADRGGVRRTTTCWFAGAAIFLAVFALPLPEPILFGALFLAGFFELPGIGLCLHAKGLHEPLPRNGGRMDSRRRPSGRNLRASAPGSIIDRRHRLSVGVLCLCNRWCPRGSGGMDRAQAGPATAQGLVGLRPAKGPPKRQQEGPWDSTHHERGGAVHRTHTARPPLWVRSMATGRSSVTASQPWAAST
jgi:hypothetical protein